MQERGFMQNILVFLGDQICGFIVGGILTFACTNRRNIWTSIKAMVMYNKEIRTSVSYLYRIKIDNKYLLIEGNKIDQFQPIGGVYKTYDSFKDIKDKLEARPEDEKRFYEKDDLRLILKGQNVSKFISWFSEKRNREISVYREFIEEVISDYGLPIDMLKDIEIEFIKRITPKISFSDYFGEQELMIYDIFELRVNNEHETLLKTAIDEDSGLVLVSGDEIKHNSFQYNGKSKKIGEHSKHIL